MFVCGIREFFEFKSFLITSIRILLCKNLNVIPEKIKATTRNMEFASSASSVYGLTATQALSQNLPKKKRRILKDSLPTSVINTEIIQEVHLKLSSHEEAMEKATTVSSESYPLTSSKEKIHPLLSNSVTKTTAATTNNPLSQVKLTVESDQDLDGLFSDDSEEDGDWDNAITVDNEIMNNLKKLFDVLDRLPPVQMRTYL